MPIGRRYLCSRSRGNPRPRRAVVLPPPLPLSRSYTCSLATRVRLFACAAWLSRWISPVSQLNLTGGRLARASCRRRQTVDRHGARCAVRRLVTGRRSARRSARFTSLFCRRGQSGGGGWPHSVNIALSVTGRLRRQGRAGGGSGGSLGRLLLCYMAACVSGSGSGGGGSGSDVCA